MIRALHFSVTADGGAALVPPVSFECPDDRMLLSGASGTGKTSVLEGMAGVSPHAVSGLLELPGAVVLGVQDALAAFSSYRRLRGQLLDARRFCTKVEWTANLESNLAALGLTVDVLALYPHQLSAGMLKRVLLAAVLAARAPLTLLDEPTAGLDPSVRWSAVELVRRQSSAYVIATHDPELLAAARIEHRLHLGAGGRRWFGLAAEFAAGGREEDSTPRAGPDREERTEQGG
ncbi:MAG: ATP-binding cassette domain-containing protein [Deltaproteobacteria bacterium]|nr:ATP-binding cassette domain-containing protein [Deltaproteobacteria bacterium]